MQFELVAHEYALFESAGGHHNGILFPMVDNWKQALQNELNSELVTLLNVGGGDFASAYRASLSDGKQIFVKTHKNPPAHFFTTEATGLDWLRASNKVNVPKVIAVNDDPPYLAMEWVELGSDMPDTESHFGQQLAQLHMTEFTCFGRPDGRTTGSQAVPNLACDSWVEFYASRRLLPLAELAFEKKALPKGCVDKLEILAGKLQEFGAADESACLLHGDLWAGNRVVDTRGRSWLIDPAAHGGHREFDLAMMRLFGGYEKTCFDAYHENYPLQVGWEDRIALHQLAPLIVHAIKFGGSYVAATESALANYI